MQLIVNKIDMTGKPILLGTIGLSAGLIISFGLVALILGLDLIPRFAEMTHTEQHLKKYEKCLMLGAILGNIITIYQIDLTGWIDCVGKIGILDWNRVQSVGLGICHCFAGVLGLFSGIYLGCWVIALTEVVDMFPILFRKIKIQAGVGWIILCAAFGKSLFSMLYYLNRW